MTRSKPLSDDLRGAILAMARTHDVNTIVLQTGQKKHTIERILSDYCKKGTVMQQHLRKELRGAKQVLTVTDMNVWVSLLCLAMH